jgi:enolase
MDGQLKLGVHIHAEAFAQTDSQQSSYSYTLGVGATALSSAEMQRRMVALWLQGRLITLDSPFHFDDLKAFKYMTQKVTYTISDLADSRDRSMAYSVKGVGGDTDCSLQVPLDAKLFQSVDLALFSKSRPHNCVKLTLASYASVSEALLVVSKARIAGWPLIISSSDTPTLAETPDTFAADFSIGVGAGQVMMGGFISACSVDKYNRILEISLDQDIAYAGAGFRL